MYLLISNGVGVYIVGVIVTFAITLLSHAQVEAGWIYVPFTTFLNYSGNPSAVYAALSSTLMASFVFCPQDTVARMVTCFVLMPLFVVSHIDLQLPFNDQPLVKFSAYSNVLSCQCSQRRVDGLKK